MDQNTENNGTKNNNSGYLFTWDDVKDSEHENAAKNNPELFKFITEKLGIEGWKKVIVRKIEDNTKIIVYNTETEDLLTFRLREGQIIIDFNNEEIYRHTFILEEGNVKIDSKGNEEIESNKVDLMNKKNNELLTKVLWFVGILIIFLPIVLYIALTQGIITTATGIISLIVLLFALSVIGFSIIKKILKIDTELKKFHSPLHVLSQQKLINLSENCVNYWYNNLLNKTKKQVDITVIKIPLIILVGLMSISISSLSLSSLPSLSISSLPFFLSLFYFFLTMYVIGKFIYFLFVIKRLSKIPKLPLNMPKYLNDPKGISTIRKIFDSVSPSLFFSIIVFMPFYFLNIIFFSSQIGLVLSPPLARLLSIALPIAFILIIILYFFVEIKSPYDTIRYLEIKRNEMQKSKNFLFKEIYLNDAIRKAAENPTYKNLEYTKHIEEAISILETKTNRLKMWKESLKDIGEILGNLKLIAKILLYIIIVFIVLGAILFLHYNISNLLDILQNTFSAFKFL